MKQKLDIMDRSKHTIGQFIRAFPEARVGLEKVRKQERAAKLFSIEQRARLK